MLFLNKCTALGPVFSLHRAFDRQHVPQAEQTWQVPELEERIHIDHILEQGPAWGSLEVIDGGVVVHSPRMPEAQVQDLPHGNARYATGRLVGADGKPLPHGPVAQPNGRGLRWVQG